MGYRHQAFVIARIVPYGGKEARYRCIGALHDQWCRAAEPLRAVQRFFTLIKQPKNGKSFAKKCVLWTALDLQIKITILFPVLLLSFLFLTAWAVDDAQGPDTVSNLPATMGFDEGDNSEGLTLVDISDPENPTYCFTADLDVVPISAEEYLLGYDPEDYDDIESLVRPFDAIPVMSEDVVAEAWPPKKKRYGNHLRGPQFHKRMEALDAARAPKTVPRRGPRPMATSKPSKEEVSSLVGLTLRPAIEQAIAESSVTDVITDLILLDSGRTALAKDIIRSHVPISEGAFILLQKLVSVQDDKSLDLSGFELSGKQITELLSLYEDSGVRSLKLCHNTTMKIEDLEQVLQKAPRTLRRLLLFETGITELEIVTLFETKPQLSYSLESVIHPAFLSGFYPQGPSEFHPVFTHKMLGGSWSISVPFFTPNSLAEGLTDYLTPHREIKSEHFRYNLGGGMAAMAAYASCSRNSETSWGERTIACIPRWNEYYNVILRKGEWVFLINKEDERDYKTHLRRCFYAFVRASKEGQAVFSDNKWSQDILFERESLDIYDVYAFFKELELEGRPSPDPDVLAKLFDLFTVDEDGDEVYCFIDHEKIVR